MAEGHRKRLIEKALNNGFDTFEPHEFVELFLFMLLPRINTNPIAHELIKKYGSFCKACNAPVTELVKIKGIGEQTARRMNRFSLLVNAYRMSVYSSNMLIQNDDMLGAYAVDLLGERDTKSLYAFCLNSKNELLYCRHIADIDSISDVTAKQIIEKVVNTATTQIVLAHNHLNGSLLPTDKDIAVTAELKDSLNKIGIFLRNHIVVSKFKFAYIVAVE